MNRALPVRSTRLSRPCLGASFRAAATVAALFVAGCAETPKEAEQGSKAPVNAAVAKEVTKKAKVESVDKTTRTVVLVSEEGKKFPVVCGPEVRNFDQIAAGDTVAVRYHESLAVALVKPGEGSPDSIALAAGRAPQGGQPGAAAGGQITQTVKIESVDLTNHVVVFTPQAGGEKQSLPVKRDEGKAFIAGLKPGDLVEITFTQAVAIAVEKQ